MVVDNIFVELSLILVLAVVVSFIFRLLKQPLIVGYIVTGILISPYVFNLAQSAESVSTFAHMGVAVLLFMVGLNLDPKIVKEVGPVALVTGIGQIVFTVICGYLIGVSLGYSSVTSLYIAIAVSFSSTIIIMKLLSDKGDTSTLYGRVSVGFLLVQDFVAILILMIVSSFQGEANIATLAFTKIGTGAVLICGVVLFSLLIVKPATKLIAKSQELLLLFSIGWAFAMASLFDLAGFSIEIGALLAGITLSVSPYRYEIGSRMKPLRDFFLLLFFIMLGSQLTFSSIGNSIGPIIIFSILVFIGNPLIVMTLMGVMGYTKRNSFLCGLTVSQISEFSFILIALGVSLGHLSSEILSIMTLIGLITMGASSYAVMGGQKMYEFFSPYLGIFERRGVKIDEGKYHKDENFDVIMFGYNRIGFSLEKAVKAIHKKFLVVDNNPEVIMRLARARVNCHYGDASDTELLDELPLSEAKMIISTVPDEEVSRYLIKKVRQVNPNAIIIVVSHQIEESLQFYEAGATYVITPHILGGVHTANLIEEFRFDKKAFEKQGAKNARELLARQKEGHRDILHERG